MDSAIWPHESRQLAILEELYRTKPHLRAKFEVYEPIIDDWWNREHAEAMKKLKITDIIHRNLVQLQIHFNGRAVLRYEDTPMLTGSAMFGTLGGVLNLWIGITFVTFIELLELFYRVSLISAYRMKLATFGQDVVYPLSNNAKQAGNN